MDRIEEGSGIEEAIRQTLRLIARGDRPRPMLRRLLLDALADVNRGDRPHDPTALVSDEARSATQWIGAPSEERAKVLVDLLLFADAIGPKPVTPLPTKIRELHRSLERGKLPHAFGGAIALAYYGEPRMTKDIDVNIFLPVERWGRVQEALKPLGIGVELEERGLHPELKLGWEKSPVHLFFSSDPLHEEMRGRVREAPFDDGTIPIVAPEHLVVRKAILNRTKDWPDIEQILVAASPLDVGAIDHWLERMVGEDDPRMRKLGEVKAALSLD